MFRIIVVVSVPLVALMVAATSHARDAVEDAAATAEVFVYGHQSKNEALLREISDPDQYEAMAKDRSSEEGEPNENVHVDSVEITDLDGDRATAKATYSKQHSKGKKQAQVHLRRVNGEWQVTKPPEAGNE